MAKQLFSNELEQWLKKPGKKTLGSLQDVFEERSFAIVILLLMAFPALPLPTGGITHIFEIIVILLSLEMIIGRRSIWLPKKWLKRELGPKMEGKFVPYFIRRVRWFEKFSRPRLVNVMTNHNFHRLVGVVVIIFALAAGVAPPFSGLDTLPALGAVIVALSVIFGDFIMLILGMLVGTIGIGLVIVLGTAGLAVFRHFI